MSSDKPFKGDQQMVGSNDAAWKVVCLCAAWCGVCRQYASDFKNLQAKYPHVQFAWLDVEDREDLLDDIDVETFPTLLIGCGDVPLFLGPLLPQIKVLERLLASLLQDASVGSSAPPEATQLWQRVVAQWAGIAAGNAAA